MLTSRTARKFVLPSFPSLKSSTRPITVSKLNKEEKILEVQSLCTHRIGSKFAINQLQKSRNLPFYKEALSSGLPDLFKKKNACDVLMALFDQCDAQQQCHLLQRFSDLVPSLEMDNEWTWTYRHVAMNIKSSAGRDIFGKMLFDNFDFFTAKEKIWRAKIVKSFIKNHNDTHLYFEGLSGDKLLQMAKDENNRNLVIILTLRSEVLAERLIAHSVAISKDTYGKKAISTLATSSSPKILKKIVQIILPHVVDLATDYNGRYLINGILKSNRIDALTDEISKSFAENIVTIFDKKKFNSDETLPILILSRILEVGGEQTRKLAIKNMLAVISSNSDIFCDFLREVIYSNPEENWEENLLLKVDQASYKDEKNVTNFKSPQVSALVDELETKRFDLYEYIKSL